MAKTPKTINEAAKTIDAYIEQFPPDVQKRLEELRVFIRAEAPLATEKISYGMPTFYLNGNLVHFAAFKDHYGFFPSPSGIEAFEAELAPYRTGKGTLRFELDKPFPWDIIRKVVQYRIAEMDAAGRAKKPKSR
jgi:uncharacterized protein YdhG (YjbR/CyaY superfamily)